MSSSQGWGRPIKVYENAQYYLVEISAKQRDRAKRIPLRRWNPELVAWVYPKRPECYEALEKEFRHDAEEFSISRPEARPAPAPAPPPQDPEAIVAGVDDEAPALSEKIESITKRLSYLEKSSLKIENILDSRLPDAPSDTNLDPDVALESELKKMAVASTGGDPSFESFLEEYQPIIRPEQFIIGTHEHLSEVFDEILGKQEAKDLGFGGKVHQLKEKDVITDMYVINILRALNHMRNQFAHSKNMAESKLRNWGVVCLMGISSIWVTIASEQIEDE